jgi:hypothetical protein
VIEAGKKALDTHGAGLSSVRFICGTHVSYTEFNKVIFLTFSILSILRVPDEGYSRNASCPLNLISTFFVCYLFSILLFFLLFLSNYFLSILRIV